MDTHIIIGIDEQEIDDPFDYPNSDSIQTKVFNMIKHKRLNKHLKEKNVVHYSNHKWF